ncbi:50S ribosomal protein L14e [archaeon]|nr:50S ribosomal protein L14e [archaeon]
MQVFEVGRICNKIRGREAGEKCTVVEVIDEKYVLVDGPNVKRRRCNIGHLEPTNQKITIKKGATKKDVTEAFKTIK